MAPATDRPTFSVIVAAYQGASVIAGAIESVLTQTRPPEEIVICDDGSSDDLEGALAPYRKRILLVRQENRGGAAALNSAARAASSEFVVQLDQDDAFAPERMEAIAELAFARPDLDIITTDAQLELDGRQVARYNRLNPFEVENQRSTVLRSCFFGWPAIRRRRLLAVGGFDEELRVAFDWDCWIKLILDGCLAGLIDEPLYLWRLAEGTLSSNPARNARENVLVLEKVLTRRPALSASERTVVTDGIRLHARRAVVLEMKAALLDRQAGVRRLALRVLFGKGFSLRTRLKSMLAAAVPGLARHLLERREVDLSYR